MKNNVKQEKLGLENAINHDVFVDNYISMLKKQYENSDSSLIQLEPEAHYNYYGTRGVADLFYVIEGYRNKAFVCEFKTNAKQVGENVRQFKRMKEYFFKDEERSLQYSEDCHFCLHILANNQNYRHVMNHLDTYSSIKYVYFTCGDGSESWNLRTGINTDKYEIGGEQWEQLISKHCSDLPCALGIDK